MFEIDLSECVLGVVENSLLLYMKLVMDKERWRSKLSMASEGSILGCVS